MGAGASPLDASLSSVWLVDSDRQPLVMVYHHGPGGWHRTRWETKSALKPEGRSVHDLVSRGRTLHLGYDSSSGMAEVQGGRFDLKKDNTFVVIHDDDPSKEPRVVPLGRVDLPASRTGEPASKRLLDGDAKFRARLDRAVAGPVPDG